MILQNEYKKLTFLSREQPSRVTNPRLAAVVAAVVDVELWVRELGLGPRVDRRSRCLVQRVRVGGCSRCLVQHGRVDR